MASDLETVGPMMLTATVMDISSPSPGVDRVIRRIHIASRVPQTVRVSLYLGGSLEGDDGKEIAKDYGVGGNDIFSLPCAFRLRDAVFLSGYASEDGALVITLECEDET